ncbi:MAG TPA: PEP-CTERM sorting domain-containing protein [Verrucomicrobiae bacterium]|nr:PEP-CTERM sorting domain-containing protein [Verrucomicrobiae bacterium]
MNAERERELHQRLPGAIRAFSAFTRNRLRVVIALGLCASLSGVAQADILSSVTISGGDDSGNPFTNVSFQVAYSTNSIATYYNRVAILFENTLWDSNDVGITQTATSATDPNFNEFVSLMTDGVSEWLHFSTVTPGKGGADRYSHEATWLFGNSSDPRVDLHGDEIDDISIQLTSFSQSGDSSSYSYVFTIDGEAIPEPSSLALVFCGGVALIATRRRYR